MFGNAVLAFEPIAPTDNTSADVRSHCCIVDMHMINHSLSNYANVRPQYLLSLTTTIQANLQRLTQLDVSLAGYQPVRGLPGDSLQPCKMVLPHPLVGNVCLMMSLV